MTKLPRSQMLFVQTQADGDALGELSWQDQHLVQGIRDAGADLSNGIVALPAPSSATAPSVLFGRDTSVPSSEGQAPLGSAPRIAYVQELGLAGILLAAKKYNLLDTSRHLIVVSDQVFGPLGSLDRVLDVALDLGANAVVRTLVRPDGRMDLTESVALANPETAGDLAMELTFVTIPAELLASDGFWTSLEKTSESVGGGENWLDLAGFARGLADRGFEVEPIYPPPRNAGGPLVGDLFARELRHYLGQQIPFLPWALFTTDPLVLERWAVVPRPAFRMAVDAGYPTRILWDKLLVSCPPQTWYTNLALLDIFPDSELPDFENELRTAVLAHVFYPDMLPEILRYAGNVPDPVKLVITTGSEENKADLEEILGGQERFSDWEVRVATTNRGRDVSAFLIDCEDVLRDESVDIVLKLHSKRSVQDPSSVSGWFKDHLFENLLHSPGHAQRIMRRFAEESQLGMVMAPVIHMGVPTMGNGWTLNKGPAEDLAGRLGMEIPFDTFTPLSPYGSMFYARREALLPLVDASFAVEEFPDAAGYKDGSVAHVLERLFSYVVFSEGYFARCVQTPSMAEVSSVALQYKYDQVSHYLFPFASRQVQMLSGGEGEALSGAAIRSLVRIQIGARYPRVEAAAAKLWSGSKLVVGAVRGILQGLK